MSEVGFCFRFYCVTTYFLVESQIISVFDIVSLNCIICWSSSVMYSNGYECFSPWLGAPNSIPCSDTLLVFGHHHHQQQQHQQHVIRHFRLVASSRVWSLLLLLGRHTLLRRSTSFFINTYIAAIVAIIIIIIIIIIDFLTSLLWLGNIHIS